MPFNDSKCLAINFGKVTPVVQYKLGATCLVWTKNTKYLRVTIQSDLTFDLHISEKSIKSNRIGTLRNQTPHAQCSLRS